MDSLIKRIVKRLFPELNGGYHLPRFGKIISLSDPLTAGGVCDEYRPRYSVNVQVLLPSGAPDDALPIFYDLPLPVSFAGHERGQFGYPLPGALVEIAFAYGLPSKPFIRALLSGDLSVSDVAPGDVLNQAAPGVFDRTNSNGDKVRETHGNINDTCKAHTLAATDSTLLLQNLAQFINEHSSELINGIKTVEAMGALKLLSGGSANLLAVDNVNLMTARDLTEQAGRNLLTRVGELQETIVGAGRVLQVTGDVVETTDGEHMHSVTGQMQTICDDALNMLATVALRAKVESGGKIYLGNESNNVLVVLSDLIGVVKDLATKVADHKHPGNNTPPITAADFTSLASDANGLKTKVDDVAE